MAGIDLKTLKGRSEYLQVIVLSFIIMANSVVESSEVKPVFPHDAATKEYAASLDAADPLRGFREKFIIPSRANIASKKLAKPGKSHFLVYSVC